MERYQSRLIDKQWLVLTHDVDFFPPVCISSFLSGTIHAIFEKGNNHYTWKKVTTTVHNIIVGKLWIDQVRLTSKMMHLNNLNKQPDTQLAGSNDLIVKCTYLFGSFYAFIGVYVEVGGVEILVFSGNSPERPFTDKITR